MNKSILIKNPLLCARMDGDYGSKDMVNSFQGGHIYIEDGVIRSAGPEPFNGQADEEIDASRMVVTPGFVNTHHHFYQTLTRNIFNVQNEGLFNWLITHYEIWREISEEAVYTAAKLAMVELLKSGCTTTSDHHYLFPSTTSGKLIDAEFRAAQELGMRFQPTRGSMSLGKSDGGLPPDDVIQSEQAIKEDTLRLIKKYHDDSPGAMTRIALGPCSPFSVTPELMKQTVEMGNEYNLQIHTHLAETLDEQQFCLDTFGMRPFAYLQSLGWIRDNAWFAHSIHLNDEEVALAGKHKMGVTHCPTSNMRLGSGIARIKDLLRSGARVSLGVDGSASNDSSNMLMELRNAMLLSRLREQDKWLTAEDVFYMGTRGGSDVLNRSDIGQISEGKQADLNLMSIDRVEYSGAQHDPLAALVFSVAMQPFDYVVVNGKIVVREGKVPHVDEKEMIKKHQELSDRIISNADRKSKKGYRRF
ncbi:MAG: 8-oxoguanine deaminase [Bacteroidales bacterium]|nr:8-oxoguanine deaminase [Bacteroidales bacterium]